MLVLDQEANKIYNLAFVKDIVMQHYCNKDKRITKTHLVARTSGGESNILGIYKDMETCKKVLQELLETAAQGIGTYKVPPSDC